MILLRKKVYFVQNHILFSILKITPTRHFIQNSHFQGSYFNNFIAHFNQHLCCRNDFHQKSNSEESKYLLFTTRYFCLFSTSMYWAVYERRLF